MWRFVLLTIFSLNMLSNPPNYSSARRSVFSILFLQSYKKAVDEVSDICPLHPISAFLLAHLLSVSSISVKHFSRLQSLSSIFHAVSHSWTLFWSFCLSLSFKAPDVVSVTIISRIVLHHTNLSQSFTVSEILHAISEFSPLPRQRMA